MKKHGKERSGSDSSDKGQEERKTTNKFGIDTGAVQRAKASLESQKSKREVVARMPGKLEVRKLEEELKRASLVGRKEAVQGQSHKHELEKLAAISEVDVEAVKIAESWFGYIRTKMPTNPVKSMVEGLAHKVATEEFNNGIELNRKRIPTSFAEKIDVYKAGMLSREASDARKVREQRIFQLRDDEEFKRHSVIGVINNALQQRTEASAGRKADEEVSFFKFIVTAMTGSRLKKSSSSEEESFNPQASVSAPVLMSSTHQKDSLHAQTFKLDKPMTQKDLEKKEREAKLARELAKATAPKNVQGGNKQPPPIPERKGPGNKKGGV